MKSGTAFGEIYIEYNSFKIMNACILQIKESNKLGLLIDS